MKFDQTEFNVEADSDKEDTSKNDPNLTTKNTDEPRKRKLGNVHITYTIRTDKDARPLVYLYRMAAYRTT